MEPNPRPASTVFVEDLSPIELLAIVGAIAKLRDLGQAGEQSSAAWTTLAGHCASGASC